MTSTWASVLMRCDMDEGDMCVVLGMCMMGIGGMISDMDEG